jgi:O-antigen/teichoic acid export membrane protein
LQRLIVQASYGIALVSIPASIGLIVFGRPILGLFGSEFISGYSVLLLLVLGRLVSASMGSVGFLLLMTGHQRAVVLAFGLNAVGGTLLSSLLLPRLGINGAGLASALTLIAWNVGLAVYVWWALGIDPTILSILRRPARG